MTIEIMWRMIAEIEKTRKGHDAAVARIKARTFSTKASTPILAVWK